MSDTAGPIRVLVVDDHELVRDGLCTILARDPQIEVVGQSGAARDAIRQAAKLEPDVVLMDVAMKDMNGIEATRQIRADHPRTRVVALSSHSDRRYVAAMFKAGASGYVLKANAYEDLRRAVRAAAAGRSYVCAEVADQLVDSIRSRAEEAGSVYTVLGPREREVLQLLAEGLSSAAIAARLYVSTSTVETHRRNLMRKLDIHSVAELTKYAVREGLTSVEE